MSFFFFFFFFFFQKCTNISLTFQRVIIGIIFSSILWLKFNLSAEEPATQEEVTSSETGDCVDMTLAIAVLAALVVMILIAFLAALIIGLRLMKTLKKKPRPTLK